MNGKREPLMGNDGATSAEANADRPDDADRPSTAAQLGEVTLSEADRAILSAIRGGQRREALRLCARQHAACVGRLCMAMTGSAAEADDLTQDTLLAAYDGFASYRAESSLRGWLLGIARRKCARHLERSVRRESKLRLVRGEEQQSVSDDLLLQQQRARYARAALAEVRPSEREALVLRYVNDLSYREVAKACGIDEVAARKRVSRAIAKLRNALAPREQ
jgi:RNA polymerase sigma-70 factor (ECF subfamily)